MEFWSKCSTQRHTAQSRTPCMASQMTQARRKKRTNPTIVKKIAAKKQTGVLETAKRVLKIEAAAITGLIERLDSRFAKAVELLYACKGRVVVTGLGKSGLIGRKVAATFSSTGTPSLFLHAAEALHGDLGILMGGDVLLTAKPRSTLAGASDIVLDIAVTEEACSLNLAPTASTAAALAMGDALAIAVLERRGFREDDFALLHPGGRLGN